MRSAIDSKNRVYVECSDTDKRVKGWIRQRSDSLMEVELPTGFVMTMKRKNRRSPFIMRMGQLEFYSDGKPVA
jgi:hypothetical protein